MQTTYKVTLSVEMTAGDPHPDTGATLDDTDRASIAAAFTQHVVNLIEQNEDIHPDELEIVAVHRG